MKTKMLFCILFIVTTCLFSTIINVPADQPTIQEGINVAVDADTVLVQPGTYVENINYNGKLITIGSLFLTTQDTTYISQTVIDGNQNGSVVKLENGEDSTAVLCGFTITNGYDYFINGGGIYCSNSSPSLVNVTITNNYAEQCGGGIYCENSSPILQNVTITGNSATFGGGIYCDDSSPSLENVTISDNSAGSGGGIYCDSSSPSLVNVTITGNSASSGGGICCSSNSSPILQNVTITGNSATSGGGIYCEDSSPSLVNVTIMGNSASSGGGIRCSSNSSPILENVTISGNSAVYGGGIYCEDSSPSLVNVTISDNSAGYSGFGGGIYCNNSSPSLVNVTISGNSADTRGGGISFGGGSPSLQNVTITGNSAYENGGGISCHNSSPSLENVTISGNSAYENGGGIFCHNSSPSFDAVNRCNIFLNFAGSSGCDLYAYNCPTIDVIVDTFTVLQPDDYFACPIDNFTFDILNAKIEQVDQDLYVSPEGSDDNSGLTVDDPLLTISYALAKILSDSTNTLTIHLSNGTYSPSGTGEIFPLYCRSYVSLLGEDEVSTILDGEGLSGILLCNNDNNFFIENMTIQNGNAYEGGGICCWDNSCPILQNVTITGNSATSGGGICCEDSSPSLVNVTIMGNSAYSGGGIRCDSSSPSLVNVTISGNTADEGGGIICCFYSNPSLVNVTISDNSASSSYGFGGGILCRTNSSPILENVTISGNSAAYGGGICCVDYNSGPSLQNVTITGNTAYQGGGIYCGDFSSLSFDPVDRCNIFLNFASSSGCDLYAYDCPTIDVIVDTFTVLQPDDYFACPIDNFTFDILNAKLEQVSQDLYVSPAGSNYNSGLTVNDPLLTISYALVKILPDSTNTHTIHLSNGTYSPSGTGEIFPLYCRSYVSLLGEDEVSTILDGEGLIGILLCDNDNNFSIENMTIQNGSAYNGGGIYCSSNSSPSLVNVTITDNTASDNGGGIYFGYSSPNLQNVTISGNIADEGGGIYCSSSSSPSLVNVTIIDNTASDNGGGIYCDYNSSPNLDNITIIGNYANRGGGIYCYNSSPNIVNVTITGNYAMALGGGIYCSYSSPSLVNVTISGNIADYGGSIYCRAISNPSLINSILWNDTPEEIYFSPDYNPNSITISYSDIQGGEAGIITNNNGTVNWLEGNIIEVPQFVGTGGYPFTLLEDSPCIDAGNPNPIYYDPEDQFNPGYALWPAMGTIINDMGAYGGPNAIGWPAVDIEEPIIPNSSSLISHLSNYPNPFNPTTTINYSLKENSKVTLNIYNIKGQKVRTLIKDKLETGNHSVIWYGKDNNCKSVSSGIYFYKLKTGNFQKVRKMILMK